MASRTPARTRRPFLVGGTPSAAPPERVCDMAPNSRPNVTPVSSAAANVSSAQRLVRLGTRVAQKLLAPVALVVLADATGGLGQGGERTQEPPVGLVPPRHRTVALPPVAAQQVEAAVVADAGIGVRRHVVDRPVAQCCLGEGGPGEGRLRVAAYDVVGIVAR